MPIQILPAQLANQIAAGEVVERPASVVKELVENSLDAGASRIEIEIERGGHKRLLIRDDGKGIGKDELELALSRHATSKIACLDDLEQILSMGFRGEALASISSVSRLSLRSKPKSQQQAWQAQTEGRDMQVKLAPIAHPDGSSVEVLDLFFNTPARRKFLRTEKTEFQHIDEVIKRIALSRFDVAFSLKHNGKNHRQLPKAETEQAKTKRIGLICGQQFAEKALMVNSEFEGFSLSGWLCTDPFTQNDHQYFYVNGRMMRDKLINHAIRQAFEGWLPEQGHAGYVLYLSLNPKDVDVNVHPAKHEVRFHQARLVHDFIYRAITDAIEQSASSNTQQASDVEFQSAQQIEPVQPNHDYIKPLSQGVKEIQSGYVPSGGPGRNSASSHRNNTGGAAAYQSLMSAPAEQSSQELAWLLLQNKYLVFSKPALQLVAIYQLERLNILEQLSSDVVSQPLLMPVSFNVNGEDPHPEQLNRLASIGLEIQKVSKKLILKKVPACLRNQDWHRLCQFLLKEQQDVIEHLSEVIAPSDKEYNEAQARTIWHTFTSRPEWTHELEQLVHPLPFEQWLDKNAIK